MKRLPVLLCGAVLALAGCGGGDDDGGGGDASEGPSGETLTVWNNEFQPDRMKATQAILDEFTQKTGIKTKLVAVPEDQLSTLMTNAAAAGELPDVVLGTPLDQSQQYAQEEIFDSEAAQAVVDKLGADTFSKKALDLVSKDGKATGVPSDGWGQLLIYRKDLFEKAGLERAEDARRRARGGREAQRRRHGRHHARDQGRRRLHRRDLRARRARPGLPAHRRRRQGDVFDSPPCVEALRWYGDIAANYSVSGAQDVDSTRGTYFAGQAAMMFWSPFLLDGMAGLRDDTKPTCDECKDNPAYLAENSGLVGPLQRGRSSPASSASSRRSTSPSTRPPRTRRSCAEFMLSDGYVRWLGLSPQGKYPVRAGDSSDPEKFQTAWAGLESGVDRKAPLSQFYGEDSIASLGDGVENFQRWGFAQGQGALVGALRGEQPIASAVADVIGGKDPAQAAKDVQATVEEIQSGLE